MAGIIGLRDGDEVVKMVLALGASLIMKDQIDEAIEFMESDSHDFMGNPHLKSVGLMIRGLP